jgi:PAS domain S-box-containing protein
MRDITEIKKTEMALRQSEERFRYLIERSPHAIVIVRDSRSIYVNSCCARMLGYRSSDEILGRPVVELFAPQYHEMIADSISPGEQDALPSTEDESVMLRKNGDVLPVSVSRTRVDLSDGQAVVLVIDDISGKKRIEEAFREKEHFVDRVLSTDPSGILVYDIPSDRIVYSNDKVTKVTGRTQDELRGMPHMLASMVHPGDLPTLAEAHKEIVKGGDDEVREIEIRIMGRDNEWKWVHLYGTPFMRDESGKVIKTISGMMDITDRKKAESEAMKAIGKLDILAGITSHDISNQVIAIMANVDLGRRLTAESAILDRLERIERSARTINSHIEFSKNYQKMGALPPQWQNVEEVIQDLDIRDEIAVLEMSEDVRALSVHADQMLKNVFHNLLEDSLRYAGRPTSVRLSCAAVGSDLRLTYEDAGPGIPAHCKNRIFEKGYGRGTGFGLFLSREVLAITGIKIEENGEPGKGVRFDILIPHGGFELSRKVMERNSPPVPEQITE